MVFQTHHILAGGQAVLLVRMLLTWQLHRSRAQAHCCHVQAFQYRKIKKVGATFQDAVRVELRILVGEFKTNRSVHYRLGVRWANPGVPQSLSQ